jgi:hypothetical protein
MRASVLGHINQLNGFARALQRGFGNRVGFASQGNDAAVVIGIHLVVQHPDTRHLAHGLNQCVNSRRVAAFAEIRHTLNQSFHGKVTAALSEFW